MSRLAQALCLLATTAHLVSAQVGSAKPVVRTEGGAIIFETGDGAILSLANSRSLACPTPAPTSTVTTAPTLAPSDAPTAAPVVDTPAFSPLELSGSVAWVEVSPPEVPASRLHNVTLLGAGRDLIGAFHPRSQRQLICIFNYTDSGELIGRTYAKGSDSTANGEDQMYYDVICPVPAVPQEPPVNVSVALMYKGSMVAFQGPPSATQFKIIDRVFFVNHSIGSPYVDVFGEGFRGDVSYICRMNSTFTVEAMYVSDTHLKCDASPLARLFTRPVESLLLELINGRSSRPLDHFDNMDLLPGAATNVDGVLQPTPTNISAFLFDTCNDSVKNSLETDADCGGRFCGGCHLNATCSTDSDCHTDFICLRSTCVVPDLDGDGQSTADGDCNDDDPTIYRGAPELYDGKDNDCDGQAKDGSYSPGKLSNPRDVNKTMWEFDGFTVSEAGMAFAQTNPVTILVIGDAMISGSINLTGGRGSDSLTAYSYRDVPGGVAAKTASGNRGGTGSGSCIYTAKLDRYSGIGPGRGWNPACTGIGPGGSGAGHATQGQQGYRDSASTVGPEGGAAYGSATTPALEPGSGGGAGGHGTARNQGGGAGGGGGGAIRIKATGKITVTGSIWVKGGTGGNQGGGSGDAGAGGGGSGGTIWLESPSNITIGSGARLDATGGQGGRIFYRGGRGGAGAVGRIWLVTPVVFKSGTVTPTEKRVSP